MPRRLLVMSGQSILAHTCGRPRQATQLFLILVKIDYAIKSTTMGSDSMIGP